ncbi:invasion associated locus B family protein [Silicimonas sp. MF1-12-2]|uniref:invasion associated locus B family protein n=1 Tax=Silicimonas sp. MF1-12-2 TaxID=3384793 RepID=UPI0039B44A24
MFGTFRTWAICLLLTFPAAVAAQDQTTTGEQSSADGNDPAAAAGLSMGAPEGEAGEPQIGQTYVAEKHGDWQLRCVKSDGEKDPCQLYQLLLDGEGNSVAEFSIFNLPEGQQAVAGATVVTPLETLLTAELRLRVDEGQVRRYPYSFCSQIGCFARIGFTQVEIDAFKAGAAGTVVIVPAAAPNEVVQLKVSLSGFTAGWNALVAANAQ